MVHLAACFYLIDATLSTNGGNKVIFAYKTSTLSYGIPIFTVSRVLLLVVLEIRTPSVVVLQKLTFATSAGYLASRTGFERNIAAFEHQLGACGRVSEEVALLAHAAFVRVG